MKLTEALGIASSGAPPLPRDGSASASSLEVAAAADPGLAVEEVSSSASALEGVNFQRLEDASSVAAGAAGPGISSESVGDEGLFDNISATTLSILSACLCALALLCIATLMWRRSRKQRSLMDKLSLGAEDVNIIKSAPGSRMNSPKMGKRKLSAPTSLSPGPYSPPCAHTPPPGAPRLATCHVSTAPDFTLPERVQPVQARDPEGRVFSFSCPRKFTHQVGEINKDLYNSSSSPMSSEEEASSLPPAVHGRLWFSVLYDAVVGQLQVNLIKVKDLPGRPNSTQQTRDPFVKMFLLPDEKSSRTSKVKKKTLSPMYNETHTFQVPQESMSTRVLRFSVYDVDRRRVRHSLGHVMLPLAGLDLTRGDVMWRDLDTLKHAAPSLGDLQVSLAHYPANDKVKVGFHRARGLQGMDDDTETNTYIRAQLHYGHKVIRTKRTSSRPTSTDHSVNESLAFTVAGRQLSQCSIVIRLMFTSPFSRQADEEYGRLVIGPYMYARGEELIHWQEMVANPKVVATRWHALNGRDQATVSY